MPSPQQLQRTAQGRFETAHWSLVVAALQTQTSEAAEAMEKLCAAYWYPLYAFLRRKGHTPSEAEDLTQQFFAERVVTKLIFQGVRPGQGKFRTWLLTGLEDLQHNGGDRQQAQKRGGGLLHLSLDLRDAEGRYLLEPSHDHPPERIYERTWAMTLLERALVRLRDQYLREGDGKMFEALRCYLPGAMLQPSYAEMGVRLGKTVAETKMAVKRFKKAYGTALRDEISWTVSTSAEVDEELRCLMQALSF